MQTIKTNLMQSYNSLTTQRKCNNKTTENRNYKQVISRSKLTCSFVVYYPGPVYYLFTCEL